MRGAGLEGGRGRARPSRLLFDAGGLVPVQPIRLGKLLAGGSACWGAESLWISFPDHCLERSAALNLSGRYAWGGKKPLEMLNPSGVGEKPAGEGWHSSSNATLLSFLALLTQRPKI